MQLSLYNASTPPPPLQKKKKNSEFLPWVENSDFQAPTDEYCGVNATPITPEELEMIFSKKAPFNAY